MDTRLVVGAYGTIGERRPRDEQRGHRKTADSETPAKSLAAPEAPAGDATVPAAQAGYEPLPSSATETLFETTVLANRLPRGTSEARERALREARAWPAPDSDLHLRDKTI